MKTGPDAAPTVAQVDSLYLRLKKEAEDSGYHLNPDVEFTKDLINGLLVNEARYGYWNCPCRLSGNNREKDLDIICPCDYRDPDITEFGACFCALYVSDAVAKGEKKAKPIPERRPKDPGKRGIVQPAELKNKQGFSLPVWRCKVCGYLCGRDAPPEKCPICKAQKDRFERFA